jgi:hypothetical protein
MTSIHESDAARSAATGLDPVHPARRPGTAAADEAARMAPARPAARTGAAERRSAAGCGTPAVLDHHVVALEAAAGGAGPLVVHMADGDRDLTPREAHVWARAGRMTVFSADGTETRFTILGPDECAGLDLGERWPAGEPESRTRRAAVAAVRDVGDVLTFPAWLARTTRLSGQRNAALHGLVRRLREASPSTVVCYGQTSGVEHHRPEHEHPYDHRGIVGREGYPKEL